MKVKRVLDNVIDFITSSVDNKLLFYISKFIDEGMNELEKAIVIYLKLGEILVYSQEFSLNHDYSKINLVKDISLDNNLVICKNWAILYYRILKHFNIEARVVKNKNHYRVEMEIADTIYSADATGYGGMAGYYSMSDIARIKCGFKIEKFVLVSVSKSSDTLLFSNAYENLVNTINDVYKKLNMKYIKPDKLNESRNKVVDYVFRKSNKFGLGSEEDIQERINVINRYWCLNLITSSLEKVQLFNYFFYSVFDGYDEDGTKCYNIYSSSDLKGPIYKLIVVEVDFKYYYYLDNGKKFLRYSKQELIAEMNKRKVVLNDYINVLGDDCEFDFYKLKVK